MLCQYDRLAVIIHVLVMGPAEPNPRPNYFYLSAL